MKMWSPFRRDSARLSAAIRVPKLLARSHHQVARSGPCEGALIRPQSDYIAAAAHDQKLPPPLFYRSGYLLSEARLTEEAFRKVFPFLPNWRVRSLGSLTFAYDPEGELAEAGGDGGRVLIFGDAFDCFDPSRQLTDIARDLLAGVQDDSRLFEVLDRLGGRFICILSSDQNVRVYNDAFGARSLFFSLSPYRTVASHSFLISLLHDKDMVEGSLLFLTSRAYAQRDVKYLPGITTVFDDIYVCPPNNCFCFTGAAIRRYWPRQDLRASSSQEALDVLVAVLEGVADHYGRRFRSHLFGLTSGFDSRPVFSALMARGVPVQAFTLYRNEAQSGSKKDVQVARTLSDRGGAAHETIDMTVTLSHRELLSDTMLELGRATGYFRVGAPYSVVRLVKAFGPGNERAYLRGFGGEILRGFYQSTSKRISVPTAEQFTRAYGVAEGSPFTRGLFKQMLDIVDYRKTFNVDINDLFYWEHRMGGWASTALMETDPVAFTVPAYNCRKLYETFLGLPFDVRASRSHFLDAVRHFRADFLEA